MTQRFEHADEIAIAVLYGYATTDGSIGMRTLLAFAAVPIAVIANGVRVAGTGLAASRYGAEAAEGFFHAFSGWLMFILAFGLLVATHKAVSRIASMLTPAETEAEVSCTAA